MVKSLKISVFLYISVHLVSGGHVGPPLQSVVMSWNLRRNNINVGADFHIMFVLFLLEKSGTFPIFFQ